MVQISERLIVIVIIVILLVCVFLIIANVKVCPEIDKPTVPFEEVKNSLKTGDVIATHGCHFLRSTIMRKYLGCKATHVAMVIRKPDDLYVIELGPYGFHPLRKTDVRMRTLRSFLHKDSHSIFALIPAPEEMSWTDEDEKKYANFKFNYFVPTMFSPYKGYKVCSSFVAMIHEDKGLLKPEIEGRHHLVSPCDYYNSPDTIFFKRPHNLNWR